MATVYATDPAPGVRVITMNRPEARNALNRELIETLFTALVDADGDEHVRMALDKARA